MKKYRKSYVLENKASVSPIVLIFGLALLSTSLVVVTADPNILSIQAEESGIDVNVVDQPTTNTVTFSSLSDYDRLFIYSQNDEIVYESAISNPQHTVTLDDGTYTLEISNNSGFVIEKQFTV